MNTRINIRDIRSYAYHGCWEEEAVIGGEYLTHVTLHCDFEDAAINDDLSKTIDYVEVRKIVEEEMAIRSKLIERVAWRIHQRLRKTFVHLHSAEVEVVKINAPIGGDVGHVAVSVEG